MHAVDVRSLPSGMMPTKISNNRPLALVIESSLAATQDRASASSSSISHGVTPEPILMMLSDDVE